MGIETIAFAALSAFSAMSTMSQASAQADAIIKSGNIATQNEATKTGLNASSANASFLNSGFAMTGTPELAVKGIYKTGQTNITNIMQQADAQAANTIAAGRTKAIEGIVSNIGMSNLAGSMGSMFDTAGSYMPDGFASGLNNMGFGEDAYNMSYLKDQREGNIY